MKNLVIVLLCFFVLTGCDFRKRFSKSKSSLEDSLIIEKAKQAFIYTLPLALMDITSKKLTNSEVVSAGKGALFNQFTIANKFPDAKFKDVVRPNADTFYNTAFLNLTAEPLVLHLPYVKDRYYLMPMLSAWTEVFVSLGSRTTGFEEGDYLISGPFWKGVVPSGVKHIESPTNLVWIIGRFEVMGMSDIQNVVQLEKKVSLTPLSKFGKTFIPDKYINGLKNDKRSPNEIVASMRIDDYFNYVNMLMIDNPPAMKDSLILESIGKIGVGPGLKFDLNNYNLKTTIVLKAMNRKVVDKLDSEFKNKKNNLVNGWNMNLSSKMGNYGCDYLFRAVVAYQGLGANLVNDAVYPSCLVDDNNEPLDGSNKYVIHFNKDSTPPVKGFWSLTLYDDKGFFVENTINRYTLGDRSKLKINNDGSLDIFIRANSPGKDLESNWLPAPSGKFNLMFRFYWPEDKLLNGLWSPPAVKKKY